MRTFDHLKLARRDPAELKRFRQWLMEAEAGAVEQVVIDHPDGYACCRLETWPRTWERITRAVQAPVLCTPIDVLYPRRGIPPGVLPEDVG